MSLADYWHERVAMHHEDSYAGVPMLKFPEDLRVYERLIWQSKPEAVVEIGCLEGGSALWFRDRMAAVAAYGGPPPRVICVDSDIASARANLAKVDPDFEGSIALIEGDITDPATVTAVHDAVGQASCMVIEDSAHTYETTSASLEAFASLVPEDGFFVVEDGYVDVDWMRPSDDWPRGVQRAIDEWLGSDGSGFIRRRDLEAYIFTCHPGGILQRSAAGAGRGTDDAANRVDNPGSMGSYSNAVRRLESRIAEEERRSASVSEELVAAEEARKRAVADLELLEIELEASAADLMRANAAIESMQTSPSWRLTAPLRRIKRFLR